MLDSPNIPTVPWVETPDAHHIPFGFEPDDPRQRLRTSIGARALVAASLNAATAVQPVLGRSVNHLLARGWSRAVTRALDIRLEIDGLEHVNPSRQYLVMPLHEGFVDVPTLLHLPLDLRFTIREELTSMPYIGPYISATRQIRLPDDPSLGNYRAMYDAIAAAVAEGDSIVLFPQGSILGIEVAFQRGVARISKRFGLPVLPVVIAGTHRVWDYPFSQTVRFGQRVAMTVLPPIETSDVSVEVIRDTEREMKALAVERQGIPARRFVPERDGRWENYAFDIDPDFGELCARASLHGER